MRPGARTLRALGVLTASSLLVPLLPAYAWLLAAAVAAVLAAALVEAWLLRRLVLTAERPAAVALSLDEQEEIPLRLGSDARRPLQLTVRQVWPELLEPASTRRQGRCRPGELLQLALPVRAVARGTASLAPPWVAISHWGLAERLVRVGEPAELSVLPNLKAVRRLHGELNRFILRGLGNRAAARLGKGREFDRMRDYVRGDDFRDIAWKASARHRKLIVREFRLDRSQDVLLCLDRGHRMAARVAHVSRLDHAVNAAVLLGYICNRMEDRVGLLSFAAEVDQGLPQSRGASHLRQLTAACTGLQPEYLHTDYLALAAHVRRRLHHRTLILLLTALPELAEQGELVRAVGMLAPQHLPLVVVLNDPGLEAAARFLPADREELCRTLVARELSHGRQRMIKELRQRGALVVVTPPGDAGVEAVNAYLEVKRRQLL